MKRFVVILSFLLALLLFATSWAAFQYRQAQGKMNRELALGNYPAALNEVAALRSTVFLFPLRWGTPFFMKDIAAEISFIEGESWYALGEKTRARESYARAAELFTDSRKTERARSYYNNATIALENSKYLEARELLHRALDPLNGDPYHAGAKSSLERLERFAAENKSESSGAGSRVFQERDPFSLWSSDKKGESKPGEKRR